MCVLDLFFVFDLNDIVLQTLPHQWLRSRSVEMMTEMMMMVGMIMIMLVMMRMVAASASAVARRGSSASAVMRTAQHSHQTSTDTNLDQLLKTPDSGKAR